ncbi:hypothetical protein ACFTZK_00455 [Streptomyces decoyicus]|uniref:hypothetical protein n=1 Tax=Streptomyces decoyicus TaxID=249567 RepID=UPI00363A17A2
MPEIRRVAVLDDYQRTAHRYAAWDSLPEETPLTYISEHLGRSSPHCGRSTWS